MRVLVACEESQRVCMEFRKLGHEAYSCDIEECSGGHPEWHIQADVLPLLNGKCEFQTVDGARHDVVGKWDMIIAFPPCTYISKVANRSHSLKCTDLEQINARTDKRIAAMQFFMKFVNADCNYIAVENPVGVMNTCYRKPDQIISPYMFADSVYDERNYVTKATCLWLKGLPHLQINSLPEPNNREIFGALPSGKAKTWEDSLCRKGGAGKLRSKTFPGVAEAMAEQWGGIQNMAQYCRYCTFLVTGNGIYCTKLNKEINEKRAKRVNRCSSFDLNPMDSFGENEKGYIPRKTKKAKTKECDGQLSFGNYDKGSSLQGKEVN